MAIITECVHFRLISMPCCGHQFCNVNSRLPTFCPCCGTHVYPEVKGSVLISDQTAILKFNDRSPDQPRGARAHVSSTDESSSPKDQA